MIGEIRKKKGLGEDLINLTSCKSLDLTSVKYGEGDDQNIRKKKQGHYKQKNSLIGCSTCGFIFIHASTPLIYSIIPHIFYTTSLCQALRDQ